MSAHARAADAAYLRRREHERRRQRTHAPVGQQPINFDTTRDSRCNDCGYHVCNCPPKQAPVMMRGGAKDFMDRTVCLHDECSGGLVCRRTLVELDPCQEHAYRLLREAQRQFDRRVLMGIEFNANKFTYYGSYKP